jgi:choline transport protein
MSTAESQKIEYRPENLHIRIMKTTTVVQGTSSHRSLDSDRQSAKSEEQILAHFGKKQQLRRNFSLMSCLGLGCTLSM